MRVVPYVPEPEYHAMRYQNGNPNDPTMLDELRTWVERYGGTAYVPVDGELVIIDGVSVLDHNGDRPVVLVTSANQTINLRPGEWLVARHPKPDELRTPADWVFELHTDESFHRSYRPA